MPKLAGTCLLHGFSDCLPLAARSCTHNISNAITRRMLLQTSSSPTAWKAVWDNARSCERDGFIAAVPKVVSTPRAAWLQRFRSGRGVAIYDLADREAWDELGQPMSYDVFPKWEWVCKVVDGKLPDYTARCIMGPNLAWLSVLGPWHHAYGKALKEAWHSRSPLWYTASSTAEDLGDWLTWAMDNAARYGPVASFENDFAWYDGSQGKAAHAHLSGTYNLAGAPRSVRKATAARRMRGCSRLGVVFRGRTKRSSGDPDTSTGNSRITGDATLALVLRGCAALGLPRDCFSIAVLGDDMICICPRSLAIWLGQNGAAFYERLGLAAKTLVKHNVWEFEYCSGRFYPTGEGRVWAPKIGRTLCKGGWRLRSNPATSDETWLAAVMAGYYATSNHVPVVRAWGRPGPVQREKHRHHTTSVHAPVSEAYQEMASLYGVTEGDLVALEHYLSALPFGAIVPAHPVIQAIIRVDVGEAKPGAGPDPGSPSAGYYTNHFG